MPAEKVRFSREQLYDLVWSKPMTTIAAGFGMSTATMKAHCRSLNVPSPWSGYWAQVAVGNETVHSVAEARTGDT